MSSISTKNDSLDWMTEVGVPPEDVQYLKVMATYRGHDVESIRKRITEIQEMAYEALLSASMLRVYPSVLSQ